MDARNNAWTRVPQQRHLLNLITQPILTAKGSERRQKSLKIYIEFGKNKNITDSGPHLPEV